MKPVGLLLALALATPLLRAQQTSTPATRPGTIEGTVVNRVTGEPLRKASVTARRLLPPHEARAMRFRQTNMDTSLSAVTDASGRFVFSNLEPGDYTLWANRAGFVGEGYRQRGRGDYENLHLDPGGDMTDIRFKLMPGAVIAGKVVDEDGDPVIGALVQALRFNWMNGERQLSVFGGSPTNDLGQYRIYDLMPGEYFVRASYQTAAQGTDEVYAPAYYPQGSDPASASSLDLAPAQEMDDTDFTLLPVHAVRVRGQVLAPTGSDQNGGFNIMIFDRNAPNGAYTYRAVRMEGDGRFEINDVTPGSYVLFALWYGTRRHGAIRVSDSSERLTGRAVIQVGDTDVNGVTVLVGPGLSIAGKVQTDSGAALPAGLRVMLQPREQPMMGTASAPVEADGTFVLPSVPDGVYRVRLAGLRGQNFYLKSATLGGQDALDTNVTISHDNPPGSLALFLDPHGGQIQGTVTNDQQPYGGATVVLVPDPPHRAQDRLYRVTRTDNAGQFALDGLPPGDYKVFAWDDIEDSAYLDPTFLAPYEPRGAEVHVDAAGRASVEAELIARVAGSP